MLICFDQIVLVVEGRKRGKEQTFHENILMENSKILPVSTFQKRFYRQTKPLGYIGKFTFSSLVLPAPYLFYISFVFNLIELVEKNKTMISYNCQHKIQLAQFYGAANRPDTSRRQRRRLPPLPLAIALVPLKCSSRNLQFPHKVPFAKEKMPWCTRPFKNEAYSPALNNFALIKR